jgi:two-component system nitrate/nitrite response regulator NarL
LFISPDTVKTHLEHIFEKLGASDRTAAVAEALRRHLIE